MRWLTPEAERDQICAGLPVRREDVGCWHKRENKNMDYGESECERVTEREILYYKRPIQSNRIQVKTIKVIGWKQRCCVSLVFTGSHDDDTTTALYITPDYVRLFLTHPIRIFIQWLVH